MESKGRFVAVKRKVEKAKRSYTFLWNDHLTEVINLGDSIVLAIYLLLHFYRNNETWVVHCSIRWIGKKLNLSPRVVREKLLLLDNLPWPPVKIWWPEKGRPSGKRLRIMILDKVIPTTPALNHFLRDEK